MSVPANFNSLCEQLNNKYHFTNILFVRHQTGGYFLDNLFVDNPNIKKLLYNSHDNRQQKTEPSTFTVIEHHELKNSLDTYNLKYDLICLDPFHEYDSTKNDIELLVTYLSDTGVMVVHDCLPPTR